MTDAFKTCHATAAGTIVTPKGRLSYASDLFTANPKKKTKDGKQKYGASLLLPPDADLTLLKEAAKKKAEEAFATLAPHLKSSLKSPFLDAYAKTGDEQFKGWVMLRVSTTTKPAIVDARNGAVEDVQTECYSGRWGRMSLRADDYEVDGNRGVSFFLSNVQLLDHDESLGGGRVNPENEFAPVETPAGAGGAGLFD